MDEAEKAIRCPPGAKGIAYAPKGILLKLADAMDVGVGRTDPKREVRRAIERHIRSHGAYYTDEKVYSLLLEMGYRDNGWEEGQGP